MKLTNDKNVFLKFEYEDYYCKIFDNYQDYIEFMYNDAIQCPICNIYYWKGCKKLCNCKIIAEN